MQKKSSPFVFFYGRNDFGSQAFAGFFVMILTAVSCFGCVREPVPVESDLTVISSNLLYTNPSGQAAAEVILSKKADVIVLVELTSTNFDLEAAKTAGYEALVWEPFDLGGAHGVGILSRVGGTGEVLLYFDPVLCAVSFPPALARIPVGDRYVALTAVHIPPPIFFNEESRKAYADLITSGISRAVLNADRNGGKAGDPVILAGDFNSMPGLSMMRSFEKKGWIDTHDAKRNEYDLTWKPTSFSPNVARIDYVLIPETWTPTFYGTLEIEGADHRAVYTGFNLD